MAKKMTKAQIAHQREVWRIRKMVQKMVSIQNSNCRICGGTENLERHHIDGDIRHNSLENITIICEECHDGIHNIMGVNRYEGLKKSRKHNSK